MARSPRLRLYISRDDHELAFERFVARVEPRLRRALVATYGAQLGREATIDVLSYAWEHHSVLAGLANPVGYLHRVGQTSARWNRRTPPVVVPTPVQDGPSFEPGPRPALDHLSEQQRAVVIMVHGYGWSQTEVGRPLDVSTSTVRNHLERA